jgi:hypothetical protein
MSIRAPSGPEAGKAKVGKAFSAMTGGPADIFKSSESAQAAPAATIREPIPIYAVDLEALAESAVAALKDARRTGWRYLVEHEKGLDVVDLPDGAKAEPELVAGAPVAENLVRSGRMAERIAEPEVDYQARILDLNLIGNSVLWLHNEQRPEQDRFVSLADNPSELKPEALIGRIRNAAIRKLGAMASAGDEGGG